MSRTGVTQELLFHVHKYVGSRRKMFLELSVQRLIQCCQYPRGIKSVRRFSSQRNL